ncbi:alpha/beta hydrolase [Plantactinospora sp. S1510]|uniref:Alpha/beta hydrolase n=1 Tax=Plantactinospora alkalitolerans TaxID=2789879 RepID=A0ABS0GPJ9_9ACTN|nr:alpha/beta hydrolase [Plantactinospora alkalitolerans]MBF9128117.1 alpha/beta hydrolase [Plantactinospora alkalitolerans]
MAESFRTRSAVPDGPVGEGWSDPHGDPPVVPSTDPARPSDDPRAVLDRPAPPPDALVRYGPDPEQVADLRWPSTAAGPPRPLVVVVHGGFWRAEYDRRHTGPLAADLVGRGYPVAQLEYRRTGQPGGGWPGTFDDVAAGVDALPALTDAAMPAGRMAPGPPILLGHSAGGHLALWYALRKPIGVRGVLALAPVLDLAQAYRLDLDGGAVAALLGGGPDDVPERYAHTDPARSPAPQVRTVILHGTLDQQVPVEMSRRYAADVGHSGAELRMVELPNSEHFGLVDPESDVWSAVIAGLHSITG